MTELSEKSTKNLLSSSVGKEAYKSIVSKWTKTKLKKTLQMPCREDMRASRNNILYAELKRRRDA